jgi:hypothetical protein
MTIRTDIARLTVIIDGPATGFGNPVNVQARRLCAVGWHHPMAGQDQSTQHGAVE